MEAPKKLARLFARLSVPAPAIKTTIAGNTVAVESVLPVMPEYGTRNAAKIDKAFARAQFERALGYLPDA